MGSPQSRLQITGSAPDLSNPKMNEFGEPVDFPVTKITDLRRPDATERALNNMDYSTDPGATEDSVQTRRNKFSAGSNYTLDDNGNLVKRGGGSGFRTRARGQRPGRQPQSEYETLQKGMGLPDLRRSADKIVNTELSDRNVPTELERLRADRKQFMDNLNQSYRSQAGGNDTMYDASDPSQTLMPAPRAPGVDESMRGRFQSRSERDRGVMQPGGMSRFPDSGDDGYRFAGRGATPGVRFDATTYRDRDDQINILTKRAEDHEKVAAADGIEYLEGGGTRYVETDPSSPNFGRAKVVMPEREQTSERRNDLIRRAAARRDGSVYESSDGTVVDFGRLNRNRDAFQKRQQERKDAARDIRTRRAQLMNYGRTGGATIAPGGGIAGPMTVGTQYRFGPNMSLNQATRMAQREADAEARINEATERAQRAQAIETYKELAPINPQAARQFAADNNLGAGFQTRTDQEIANIMDRRKAYGQMSAEEQRSLFETVGSLPELERRRVLAELGVTPEDLRRHLEDNPSAGTVYPWLVKMLPDLAEGAASLTVPGMVMGGTGLLFKGGQLLEDLGVLPAGTMPEENPMNAPMQRFLQPVREGARRAQGILQEDLDEAQEEDDRLRRRFSQQR
tara:strand:+ start:698 stop:2572 length:1875 start_codon:yes stop_codon:yes gene_type:complete